MINVRVKGNSFKEIQQFMKENLKITKLMVLVKLYELKMALLTWVIGNKIYNMVKAEKN